MSFSTPTRLAHVNRYPVDRGCEHCHGVVRHETWCITRNYIVLTAYQSVLDETKLTEQDRLILHALGVAWKTTSDEGNRQSLFENRK